MSDNGLLKAFTVKRSEWFTAKHPSGRASKLAVFKTDFDSELNAYNKEFLGRCCLGFACQAVGYTDEQMANLGYPYHLSREDEDFPRVLDAFVRRLEDGDGAVYSNGALSHDAALINDCSTITDAEREVQLIELFAKHGIEVTFVD
jgi:hypothetical protein